MTLLTVIFSSVWVVIDDKTNKGRPITNSMSEKKDDSKGVEENVQKPMS